MPARGGDSPMVVQVEGLGEAEIDAGDTLEDNAEATGDGAQQLPGLPPMIGQDGQPLIIPIRRAKTGR